MRVTIISASEREAWSRAIESTAHDVFASLEWAIAAAEIDSGEPRLILVSYGEQSMVIPVLMREYLPGIRDAISPYGYAGPAYSEQCTAEFRENAIWAAADALRGEGAVTWFIRCNPILDASPPARPPELVHHGPTVSIDLRQDRDARWRQMNSGHRYEIRRALREGLEVARATSPDEWRQFQALYESTMNSLNSRSYYIFTALHWNRLHEMDAAGCATLLMARIGSQPIGGAVFLCKPGTPISHYHLSGTNPAYQRLSPSKALIAHAQDYLAALGFSSLHLGGGLGARQDSLYQFKRGFSQLTHSFHSRRLVLDKERYAALCGTSDSQEDGRFPGYRR